MATMDESPFSLISLEDELSCSICLSPFNCPVTIPCGHNFCQDCLLATWKDCYSCPQCRTVFATKPELKKNTVLSTVVETLNSRLTKSGASVIPEKSKAKKKDVIRCDACMEAEASQTCHTCMASFCEEHLRPHQENPVFRVHQLTAPVSNLLERICTDHHKLMEFYCSQHARSICSICLQQVHKGCSFISSEDQRNLKESDLRGKLGLLDGKITKNETVVSQMRDMQNKLKDSATKRMKTLSAEYEQMRVMLARDERDALMAVERELESGQAKLKGLMKKFTENIDSMSKAKEDIHSLLSQSQTLGFLQASYNLPQNTNFDPYTPRINLDSKKVIASQAFAAALKEHLAEMFNQPFEARQVMLKPEKSAVPVSGSTGSQPESEQSDLQWQRRNPRSHSPGRSIMQPFIRPWNPVQHAQEPQWGLMATPQGSGSPPKAVSKKKVQKPKKGQKSTEDTMGNENLSSSMENLLEFNGKEAESREQPVAVTSDIPPNITSSEKRGELLKYATVLTLDQKTAHKRIALNEGFTKASVSDEHENYPDSPERFTVCSQVLTSKGFSRGRHYWEVKLSSNNFIGLGLAYKSIDRKGPTSRLGRNAQSWCVEWFNVKLSAWHNSSETVLVNPNSKRVGVLLDCEEGTATFYNVAGRAYPFHSFVFPFTEAVYPAFWIFSSGSSISLCKLQD
ncbi:E3 ubiquitin/ISG15 ligase TRIM25 isoform X2 [Larimichthys crocea]|uniref:E3 ubiquitin/ISG15 ligase TRIM25 isoform X2 n=1 Tax=Larimichthys crocea TaxID=215358 RepID=UPI000F5F4315|nr:E3 ubiquitin/ISG15 ligase TRIM25 isoform X2 [Larimichthys crocea]